jgi:hypothetical protein
MRRSQAFAPPEKDEQEERKGWNTPAMHLDLPKPGPLQGHPSTSGNNAVYAGRMNSEKI